MTQDKNPFTQFQDFLREMFQFDYNELDFGLFKVLRLKRTYIEQFISGDGEQDLRRIVSRELQAIRSADDADERQWLANRCELLGLKAKKAWESTVANVQDAKLQDALRQAVRSLEEDDKLTQTLERLDRWLQAQQHSTGHLEAQLYNYLLNFFELYYQNGDFGYNSRAASAFKVPYEADYDGADTLFHYKHKDCYYIKTANSFPEVRLDVLGKKLVFRLHAGGDADTTAQNNNKDSDIKLYQLTGVAEQGGECVVTFQLAKAGTPKAEIYPRIMDALTGSADMQRYLWQKGTDGVKPIFKDLGKDHDKTEGGQVKGINQLRLSADAYLEALAKQDAFKGLGKNAGDRQQALKQDATAQALLQIDKALNRFYVGQDADYFIHKDLHGFLSREKDRFIKNVIFSNLDALLDLRADAATRVLARAFNAVASRIIEFLDATETFQKNLFTLKKKVIDTHWLISLGKIPQAYWPRLLAHAPLRDYWQREFKQTVSAKASLQDLQALPTLVVDTSLFNDETEQALIDEILSDPAFDHLDEQTDGLLIHSENWQALNLLQEKFRERIQCIYIDPPYNTGGDGFLYKDSFRHSSWAAMMTQTLQAIKAVQQSIGSTWISIDSNEYERLYSLVVQTFGDQSIYRTLIWQKSDSPNEKKDAVATYHEYVLGCSGYGVRNLNVYQRPKPEILSAYTKTSEDGRLYRLRQLRKNGKDARREDRPNCWFKITAPDGSEVYPVAPEGWDGRWVCDESGFKEINKNEGLDGITWIKREYGWVPYYTEWAPEEPFSPYTSLLDDLMGNRQAKSEYKDVLGDLPFSTPKPKSLISRVFDIGAANGSYVADFFAGSGTTGHAVIVENKKHPDRKLKFLMSEMGTYFVELTKPRVARAMFSVDWDKGEPTGGVGYQTIVKVQRFEQYEDVVNNLDTAWDAAELPPGVPLRYLFRPDQNAVRQSLNLGQPFANTVRAGQNGALHTINLLETWALLQGYWVRSRRVLLEGGKRYAALETTCGCLVLLRDMAEGEDDSAVVNAIAARYQNDDGSPRIQRLELNLWADLRKIKLPCTLLTASDFDRGTAWN